MDGLDGKAPENSSRPVDLLNEALRLEYSLMVYYPRIAEAIQDDEVRVLALELGSASIKHADTTARAVARLGGKPYWSLEPFPQLTDLIKIFQIQLEKERLALRLHQQNAALMADSSLRAEFINIAKEEVQHIQIVETILSRLAMFRG